MKINIKFGVEHEKKRVEFTLSKSDWYKAHNYNPLLPNEAIEKEFKKEDYENAEKELKSEFSKIEKSLEKSLIEKFGSNSIPPEYDVILTKYGVAGSYNLPNKIIINISAKKSKIEILKHEIIHLIVENEVKKRDLTHEEKENLVNSLMAQIK